MSLARPRYLRIERLVDDLLDEHGVTGPPIPVEAIVRATQGVAVRYSDLKDISGLVIRKDGIALIGVHRHHSPARRRFTLAHEYAHALLHGGKELRFDTDFRVNLRSDVSSAGTDIEEVEANFFAASLLMPRRFLDRDPRTATIEIEDAKALQDLARAYTVSAQAMSVRLLNLYGRRVATAGQRQLFSQPEQTPSVADRATKSS
jgi:Zn-dependent peptidase ImmA (M78 family)